MDKVLNLTPSFRPISGCHVDFDSFVFSGGEPHIRIRSNLREDEIVHVTQRINSFQDLGLLVLATDALKRMGVRLGALFIPYFPGARQDRVMVPGEALTVKVYADLINYLEFNKVYIFDPHSEVTLAVLNRSEGISNHQFIKEVKQQLKSPIVLVSPDGGALKKIYKLSESLGGIEVVECSKKRDVKTGKLSGFTVYGNDLEGKNCLIVDDICDGGGTFVGLAGALKEKNAGKLYLAVSHGIFSKGLEDLKVFEQIFTTNSIFQINTNQLIQIDLNFDSYLLKSIS